MEGSWLLTGEQRRYNKSTFAFDAPPIDHPFDLKNGTWGAFELAFRYSDADLNYDAGLPGVATPRGGRARRRPADRGGRRQLVPEPAVRFMVDYQHVKVDRLSPNAVTFQTPVGAEIGQSYNAISVRSQFAF